MSVHSKKTLASSRCQKSLENCRIISVQAESSTAPTGILVRTSHPKTQSLVIESIIHISNFYIIKRREDERSVGEGRGDTGAGRIREFIKGVAVSADMEAPQGRARFDGQRGSHT